MEVHAQVASASKLFSGASTEFGNEPNSNVSFVDAAMPGMLPVINEFCVEQAVKTGLGLKAKINLWSAFDRKNYFYPDLPKGYQISQFDQPICLGGQVFLEEHNKTINVTRIHMEEDAGKLNHQGADGLTSLHLLPYGYG
jgi:aspartyl-tRNA(Asn)/glutamyl-tRNA(Gln) amidotransferase subunit B